MSGLLDDSRKAILDQIDEDFKLKAISEESEQDPYSQSKERRKSTKSEAPEKAACKRHLFHVEECKYHLFQAKLT